MKCPSCQFNNMPGNARCIRCGASLQLATAAISIEPPRANATVKRLRHWLPIVRVHRMLSRLTEVGRGSVNRAAGFVLIPLLPLATWTRMIVPGWAQAHEGDIVRGKRFFSVWIGLALLSMATWGSQIGAVCLGLLAATHIASIIDIWRMRADRGRQYIAIVVVAFTVVAAIYIPTSRVLLNLVATRQWNEIGEPFASGDVVLINTRAYAQNDPKPGDVVLYRGGQIRYAGQQRGHNAIFQIDGQWVDRIIAGPGSKVRWEDGQLWVDGQPSDLRP